MEMRILPQAQEQAPLLRIMLIFTTLALALLTSPPADAQTPPVPVPPRPVAEGNTHTKEEIHDRGRVHTAQERNEHIPPILLFDGSLTFETGTYQNAVPSGNPRRPHKYTMGNGKRIYRVVVTAFTEDGIPYYYPWNLVFNQGWEVKVWLQKLKPNPQDGYEDVSTIQNEPQIIIRDSQEIEIDKPTLNQTISGNPNTGCQATDNPVRRRRCHHPSYGGTHFRIKRVELVNGSSVYYPLLPSDADRDRVIISVYYR
jgi:hypothetical protein